jgi:hypothetical protein
MRYQQRHEASDASTRTPIAIPTSQDFEGKANAAAKQYNIASHGHVSTLAIANCTVAAIMTTAYNSMASEKRFTEVLPNGWRL